MLLLGGSGTGKSDLALRLIDSGAQLIADDRVLLSRNAQTIYASVPERLAGVLEVHGLGIVTLPYIPETSLDLVVTLVSAHAEERHPEPCYYACEGINIPLLSLYPFAPSTPAKIRVALKHAASNTAENRKAS